MQVLNLPKLIAHRGASKLAPENTLAAIKIAHQHHMTWFECDVRITQDNHAILLHDNTTARVSDCVEEIDDLDLNALRKLDAGSWFDPQFKGEKIPTLKEVLEFALQHHMNANLEIKYTETGDIAREQKTAEVVCKTLKPYLKQGSQFLVSSFSIDALKKAREVLPNTPMAVLLRYREGMHTWPVAVGEEIQKITPWPDDWAQELKRIKAIYDELNCCSVNVNKSFLTQARVKQFKTIFPRLMVYTVDDRQLAEQLFSWGIDGIFSNDVTLLDNES